MMSFLLGMRVLLKINYFYFVIYNKAKDINTQSRHKTSSNKRQWIREHREKKDGKKQGMNNGMSDTTKKHEKKEENLMYQYIYLM